MRRAAGRAGGAREDDAEHVGRADLLDERRRSGGARPPPAARTTRAGTPRRRAGSRAGRRVRARLLVRPEEVAPEGVEVVLARLHAHQQAVEARDVAARGVVARLERLDERRPRARRTGRARGRRLGTYRLEQRLDELGHELAEVRVQAVDVLRALALGQLGLGPGERPVDAEVAVERLLGRSPSSTGFAAGRPSSCPDAREPSTRPNADRAGQ